jgi:hypothetical protein
LLDDYPLDLSQNAFAFGHSQTQRLGLELGPLQRRDLVHLLLPAVGDRDDADLEDHATTCCPIARSFRLISRRSQRRG